jgi:MFS family permease
VVGPLVATALLAAGWSLRDVFFAAVVPGAIALLVLSAVREQPQARASRGTPSAAPVSEPTTADGVAAASPLPRSFIQYLAIVGLFALGNASDAFLLLRLCDTGIAAFWIPLLWAALHVVKVASSLAGGELSDRLGRRHLIAAGWLFYAAVYAGFALVESPAWLVGIFLSYGIYFGLTEGVEKAWIADLAPATARGTAFGFYNATIGIGALLASVIFGIIWTRVSPEAAFFTGAALAVVATGLLYLLFSHEEDPGHQ